ncbi:MAG: ZIP family metal transporter [Deltaproteobacteria bacterium]|nr:ZIP family metal transporter [Deltaproteobacteria bacterium]
MSQIAGIALALTLDALAGLVGGVLPDAWLRRQLGPLVGFAAGALIAVAFLDLLPEVAGRMGPPGFALALAAFTAAALAEWRLEPHLEHKPIRGPLPGSLLGSDALHNMGDGAAIAAAFLASTKAGVLAAGAVILHEVPQEVGDYALLRAANISRSKALLGLFAVQLTAFVGAALVLVVARHAAVVTSVAVALAAGTFLFIGATDLLPELSRGHGPERRRRRTSFVLGLLGVAALTAVLK